MYLSSVETERRDFICSRGIRISFFFGLLTLDGPLDGSDVGFLSSFLYYPMDVKAHAMTL